MSKVVNLLVDIQLIPKAANLALIAIRGKYVLISIKCQESGLLSTLQRSNQFIDMTFILSGHVI